jgi:hypothetical protein
MGFSLANLTRWLLIAGVALAVASPAQAQRAGRRPGQAIVFSSTDEENVSSNTLSLAPKPPSLLDFANTIQSPDSKPGAAPETDLPPGPPPAISPAQVQRLQRRLDEQKNWALMTPEQILNPPTTEKMLHLQERDAFGQPKNETVEEQYYARQNQLRVRTNNVSYGAADAAPRWGFSDTRELHMEPNVWTPAGGRLGSPALLDQPLNGPPDNHAAPAQAQGKAWAKSFSLPAPAPAPTTEQQAAMEQFQQLLRPRSLSSGDTKTPALGSPIFSPSPTAANPAPGSAAEIPMGATYAPLGSGIAVPAGVTPLPGLLGPTNMGLPVFAPEWKPQAPPWASSAPQPGTIPQRKF